MNAKIPVFAICVETIIYFLLHNLHDCNFNGYLYTVYLVVNYIKKVQINKKSLEFRSISTYLWLTSLILGLNQ